MELCRLQRFVPAEMWDLKDVFYTEQDQALLEAMLDENGETPAPLSAAEIGGALGLEGAADELLEDAYHRFVVDKVEADDGIRFVPRAPEDMFNDWTVFNQDAYRALPDEARKTIADWLFEGFMESKRHLTKEELWNRGNKVLPMEQAKEFLREMSDRFTVIPCDCHCKYEGETGYTKNTCISYEHGLNTHEDRKVGIPMDLDQAMELVEEADRIGLVHCPELGFLCNCNRKYCYPMRGSFALGVVGTYPNILYRVTFDESRCIGCGVCLSRCQFDVFTLEGGVVSLDKEKCWGCGLCANTCPGGALGVEEL